MTKRFTVTKGSKRPGGSQRPEGSQNSKRPRKRSQGGVAGGGPPGTEGPRLPLHRTIAEEPKVPQIAGLMLVDLKVYPGASVSRLDGVKDGRLRVRIAAPAEGGKANAELCAFFARLAGCRKRDAVLKSGEKSRLKTLALPLSCLDALESAINTGGSE